VHVVREAAQPLVVLLCVEQIGFIDKPLVGLQMKFIIERQGVTRPPSTGGVPSQHRLLRERFVAAFGYGFNTHG
jgi:hypothetical protein